MTSSNPERSGLFSALVGLASLAILLVVRVALEAWFGGEIIDHPALQAVHFPSRSP